MAFLTEKQRDVLGFIAEQVEATGVAPTLREIAEYFGFSSTASAQKHVLQLERKSFLVRDKHQKRGLELTDRGRQAAGGRIARAGLPLLGAVAAGSPIESLGDDERVDVPTSMLGHGDHFVLRVRGDSMIDDGIHDGDLVVVRRADAARDGEMIVALVAGEVTLKRLFREPGGRVRLQPANPTYPPLLASAADVAIQGLIVGLLRTY